jgi:hypothetical protein
MVGAHVAHDCVVGDNVTFANNATLGGHVQVGDYVFMGGLSGVHQWTRIGRYAFVGAAALVTATSSPTARCGATTPTSRAEPGRPQAPRLRARDDQRPALGLPPAVRRRRHLPGAPGRRRPGVRRHARGDGDRRLHPRRRQPARSARPRSSPSWTASWGIIAGGGRPAARGGAVLPGGRPAGLRRAAQGLRRRADEGLSRAPSSGSPSSATSSRR